MIADSFREADRQSYPRIRHLLYSRTHLQQITEDMNKGTDRKSLSGGPFVQAYSVICDAQDGTVYTVTRAVLEERGSNDYKNEFPDTKCLAQIPDEKAIYFETRAGRESNPLRDRKIMLLSAEEKGNVNRAYQERYGSRQNPLPSLNAGKE